MKRRDFLHSSLLLLSTPLLPGCGDSDDAPDNGGDPGTDLPGNLDDSLLDYPRVLPLPFAHGVASGDPLADRVIIWTRITESAPSADAIPVRWEVAATPDFTTMLKSGTQNAVAAHDWTVKVDVTGLVPATSYYYRFRAFNRWSIVGRTRTAPADAVDEIRLAVVACSSYWSSHWSGYGHLADRNDLDLVLHCGDYIYDFVDEDEEVRARLDRKDINDVDYRDWLNLDEVRRRYALFRSDPNLLRAHQQHPWMIVWDNHDIDPGFGNELDSPIDPATSTCTLADTARAFHEWTPTRPVKPDSSGEFVFVDDGSYPLPADPLLIYRKLAYGPLLDIVGVDTQSLLPRYELSVDSSHLPDGAPSLYGRRQFEWLTGTLLASQQAGTTWRLINNQTWFAPVDIPDVVNGIPTPKLGISRWADYAQERAALCRYLRGDNPASLRIRNNVLVSGDAHGNLGSDVIEDNALLGAYVPGVPLPNPRGGSTPDNLLAGYMRATTGALGPVSGREASVGVEFAPSSMGRGGADELVTNAAGLEPGSPLGIVGARALELALIAGNKNVQFVEWVDHGYGIVSLTSERAIFEWWWQDKLTPGSPDVLGQQMVAWAQTDTAQLIPRFQDQIDAVTAHGMAVSATQGSRVAAPAPLDNALLMPR
ncbi:MAG: alkaline phosphatase D family protein [Sinimarinibacterium flocculans]|uniref:alkaline phosphatase D family protein n=1 Tax=Sinimarinibacterium flocculans TaxID=985250 RepID=UPI003C6976A0